MKELFEIGVVFRGFVLVSETFKELPVQPDSKVDKDLRGAFISAITTFVESCFQNNNLEYLESGNVLFIFKIAEVKSKDGNTKEPLIFYGLVDKKKKSDKLVKTFMERVQPMIEMFVHDYNNKDFTEVMQFHSFKAGMKKFFEN